MTIKTKLSDSEWKIISALWEESPLTLRQIIDRTSPETGWSKHTVISFLKRMLEKGTIRMEEAKPARLYYPLIDRDSAVEKETRRMLDKLYKGKTGLLVSNLVEQEALSDEDINEMIEILEAAKGGSKDE